MKKNSCFKKIPKINDVKRGNDAVQRESTRKTSENELSRHSSITICFVESSSAAARPLHDASDVFL